MSDVKVNFMHPTDGRIVTVTMDNSMTTQEAIGELISNNFIPSNPQGYNLAPKGDGRPQLQPSETFAQAGIKDGDTLRVIPATDAGV
jgi:hypothetical protein